MKKFIVILFLNIVMVTVVQAESFRNRASTQVDDEASAVSDIKAEIKFGREVAARIFGRHRALDDEQLNRYINLVGKALALQSSRSELEYRFAVLNTDSINAYAAPGGYIFVTKAAIELMSDEAELAGVLAHEIAHIDRKHIVRELNIRGTDESPTAGLARFLGGATDTARVAFSQMVDKAVAMLFSDGLKQVDEFEADEFGTLLLANSGYDGVALQRYLSKVQNDKKLDKKVLNKTHPSFDARLTKLQILISEYSLDKVKGGLSVERFNTNIASLID